MRDATLLFLVKKSSEEVKEICLAMKKRGFGVGRWNGAGGKVNKEEEVEDATKRETKEEIGVDVEELEKVAKLSFYFPHKEEWNQVVHVYFAERWSGDIKESEEMKPAWFSAEELPFDKMWPDDVFWVPEVLKGNKVEGVFVFGEGDVILEKKVEVTESLS